MLTRAWRAEFDLQESEGRIISGIAVPYDSPTTIAERGLVFEETFKRGAFRETMGKRADRVKLLGFHDSRAMPLGRPTKLDEQARGLYIEARISDTRDGNDALTLARDGVLDGFSIGFSVPSGGDTWNIDQTQREITNAHLHEVSMVNFPAYDRARLESVRSVEDRLADPRSDAQRAINQRHDAVRHVYIRTEEGKHYFGDGCVEDVERNSAPEEPASIDLSARYGLEVARLQLLRLEFI